MKKLIILTVSILYMAGCSTNSAYHDAYDDEMAYQNEIPENRVFDDSLESKRASIRLENIRKRKLQQAYERGVRDTMNDFKGRMRGSSAFVYEPSIIENVEMPPQVINGVLVPRHTTPVILSPGRWVEENGVLLPRERQ